MLTQNWTVKAEALYIDLGRSNFTDNSSYNLNFTHELLVGKVGLNYKF